MSTLIRSKWRWQLLFVNSRITVSSRRKQKVKISPSESVPSGDLGALGPGKVELPGGMEMTLLAYVSENLFKGIVWRIPGRRKISVKDSESTIQAMQYKQATTKPTIKGQNLIWKPVATGRWKLYLPSPRDYDQTVAENQRRRDGLRRDRSRNNKLMGIKSLWTKAFLRSGTRWI